VVFLCQTWDAIFSSVLKDCGEVCLRAVRDAEVRKKSINLNAYGGCHDFSTVQD
jgi:hypothetical protein